MDHGPLFMGLDSPKIQLLDSTTPHVKFPTYYSYTRQYTPSAYLLSPHKHQPRGRLDPQPARSKLPRTSITISPQCTNTRFQWSSTTSPCVCHAFKTRWALVRIFIFRRTPFHGTLQLTIQKTVIL